MRNTWIICLKELRSYFASPVAYLLLTMFALIFGTGAGMFTVSLSRFQDCRTSEPMSSSRRAHQGADDLAVSRKRCTYSGIAVAVLTTILHFRHHRTA